MDMGENYIKCNPQGSLFWQQDVSAPIGPSLVVARQIIILICVVTINQWASTASMMCVGGKYMSAHCNIQRESPLSHYLKGKYTNSDPLQGRHYTCLGFYLGCTVMAHTHIRALLTMCSHKVWHCVYGAPIQLHLLAHVGFSSPNEGTSSAGDSHSMYCRALSSHCASPMVRAQLFRFTSSPEQFALVINCPKLSTGPVILTLSYCTMRW